MPALGQHRFRVVLCPWPQDVSARPGGSRRRGFPIPSTRTERPHSCPAKKPSTPPRKPPLAFAPIADADPRPRIARCARRASSIIVTSGASAASRARQRACARAVASSPHGPSATNAPIVPRKHTRAMIVPRVPRLPANATGRASPPGCVPNVARWSRCPITGPAQDVERKSAPETKRFDCAARHKDCAPNARPPPMGGASVTLAMQKSARRHRRTIIANGTGNRLPPVSALPAAKKLRHRTCAVARPATSESLTGSGRSGNAGSRTDFAGNVERRRPSSAHATNAGQGRGAMQENAFWSGQRACRFGNRGSPSMCWQPGSAWEPMTAARMSPFALPLPSWTARPSRLSLTRPQFSA